MILTLAIIICIIGGIASGVGCAILIGIIPWYFERRKNK